MKNSVETLIVAYHSIAMFWYKESLITGQRILAYCLNDLGSGTIIRKSPLGIFRLHTYATSSFRFFPSATLQRWELLYKGMFRSAALCTLSFFSKKKERLLGGESNDCNVTSNSTSSLGVS